MIKNTLKSSGLSHSTLLFGSALIAFQAIDGVLTSLGINRAGIQAEANPMIRSLMLELGHIPALAVTKTIAICLILFLISLSLKRRWIEHVLIALSCIYFIGAIIPWTYLLFFRHPIS
jgi:hypothetical protein